MNVKFSEIPQYLRAHVKLVVFFVICCVLLLASSVMLLNTHEQTISVTNLTADSVVKQTSNTAYFSLNAKDNGMYTSAKTGKDAAWDFVQTNPPVNGSRLLPPNYDQNAKIIRESDDANSPLFQKAGVKTDKQHFYFTQSVQGIPVYESSLLVHIQNNNEVYKVDGNVLTNTTVPEQKISEEQAKQIALSAGQKEAKTTALQVKSVQKYIFNKKISQLSNDERNYLVLDVFVTTQPAQIFATDYFVDLVTGNIVYKKPIIVDLLNRDIENCAQGSNCPTVRTEGGPATGDSDADTVYGYFSTVYNFYKNTFGRDSYDGAGATLYGVVHYPGGNGFQCPNAAWDGQEMVYCNNLIALDVTGHELTHAVEHSVLYGMGFQNETGSLDESIADIFGSAQDNNWNIGWDLPASSGLPIPLRDMADPNQSKERPGGEPDKLFASNFYCGTGDYGGRHLNSSVFSKAFYLMTDGGNFNSCQITGQGRDKTNKIMYHALTSYFSATSNFKDAYSAMNSACADLYQANSDTCNNVQKAMMAVELDQQPDGQQTGPLCTGGQEKQPSCGSVGSGATDTPNPNQPTATPGQGQPTDTPTPIVQPTPAVTKTPAAHNSISGTVKVSPQNTGVAGAVIQLHGTVTKSATTNQQGAFSFGNLPNGNYSVSGTALNVTLSSYHETFPPDAQVFIPWVLYKPPTPTPTPTPTATPAPQNGGGNDGGGGSGGSNSSTDTPTPTPVPYHCFPDPNCQFSGNNIHLCQLKCCAVGSPNCN